MIPNFAVVAIDTAGFHPPRLWVPLFLLWIPLVLLSPLIFLVLVAVAIGARTTIWRLIGTLWGILAALPGTHVHVSTIDSHVVVRIL